MRAFTRLSLTGWPRPGAAPLGGLAVAVGFVLCWSSGFVGSRLAVAVDTPVLSLYAWRFALATLLAGLWWALRATRRRGPGLSPRALAREALVGSLTVGAYLLAMLLAVEAGVSAGVAALIGALQPLAATTLAGWWLGERTRPAQWLGMSVATLGAGLSVLDDLQGVGGAPAWAYGLPLLAVAAVTLGSVLGVRRPAALGMEARLTSQLGAATVVFWLAAVARQGDWPAPPPLTPDTLTALAWLILLATFGGYGFFIESLRRFGVSHSAALVALTPAVTLGWTALLFGELPGGLGAAGMGLGLLGAGAALVAGRRRGRGASGHAGTGSPLSRRGGRSDPRPRAPAARRGPRTW
ncbi:DMT family transporter [Halomonas stenophila]|uniref:Drug/metabolite transporter (DMT)-like permease n=1 Tax=Halomonas stenophila TaxID=795312 RepID=A0A7W5HKK1_9GAMM|nr:DMT family transporter [Halomonas stenophila]MBB3230517.1 drug/metabolite transporter (DMT)-like permease [Halomonas stenophila]